jgi:hypothetical protein
MMFDPTVYENLKVVLEGSVYDLDLAGSIRIIAREDWVNLAAMSRSYRIAFRLSEDSPVHDAAESAPDESEAPTAEITLSTELSDLAAEILELESEEPGCSLDVSFLMELPSGQPVDRICREIQTLMNRVWGGRFEIRQTLSYDFGDESGTAANRIRVLFGRRFSEDVAEDFPQIIDHAVLALEELARTPIR